MEGDRFQSAGFLSKFSQKLSSASEHAVAPSNKSSTVNAVNIIGAATVVCVDATSGSDIRFGERKKYNFINLKCNCDYNCISTTVYSLYVIFLNDCSSVSYVMVSLKKLNYNVFYIETSNK